MNKSGLKMYSALTISSYYTAYYSKCRQRRRNALQTFFSERARNPAAAPIGSFLLSAALMAIPDGTGLPARGHIRPSYQGVYASREFFVVDIARFLRYNGFTQSQVEMSCRGVRGERSVHGQAKPQTAH
jgi:hypothetical protein